MLWNKLNDYCSDNASGKQRKPDSASNSLESLFTDQAFVKPTASSDKVTRMPDGEEKTTYVGVIYDKKMAL